MRREKTGGALSNLHAGVGASVRLVLLIDTRAITRALKENQMRSSAPIYIQRFPVVATVTTGKEDCDYFFHIFLLILSAFHCSLPYI